MPPNQREGNILLSMVNTLIMTKKMANRLGWSNRVTKGRDPNLNNSAELLVVGLGKQIMIMKERREEIPTSDSETMTVTLLVVKIHDARQNHKRKEIMGPHLLREEM